MSSFKKTIPFETEEGNQYLMEFSQIDNLDGIVSIPVIDISLVLTSSQQSYNSIKTLNKFSMLVLGYLKEFSEKTIIYFYCDKKETLRRNINQSPQEYRSLLFKKLYLRKINNHLIFNEIKIADPKNGDHFICLITHIKNKNEVENIKYYLTHNYSYKENP